MAKTLLLLACVLFSQIIFAQFNETDFEHYTVSNGLSDNNVNDIAQDELGYIWIGTDYSVNGTLELLTNTQ